VPVELRKEKGFMDAEVVLCTDSYEFAVSYAGIEGVEIFLIAIFCTENHLAK
jgi:hypothetical protein